MRVYYLRGKSLPGQSSKSKFAIVSIVEQSGLLSASGSIQDDDGRASRATWWKVEEAPA